MKWQPPYSREKHFLPDPILETERLILRPITTDDWPCIWELESDPEVMRFIVDYYRDPVAHREEFLADIAKGERYKFFYAIVPKKTGRPVGWILFRPTPDGKWIELGYRVVRRTWGQGFVPEGARHIIDTAFRKWGLKEVVAVLMPDNKKSARAAEKLGMKYKGTTADFYDMDLALYRIEAAGKADNAP